MTPPFLECVELSLNGGILVMTLSRPGGNAMSHQFFKDWHKALKYAQNDNAVRVLVVTGKGKFFSSGKDLQNVMHDGFEKEMNAEMDTLQAMVDDMINFRKPMIAAVNGPAIGFGVTCLAHFDFVYAVESATFTVPFMR
ncbi:ClpP/crotonase-like domain-containing protein, partial [Protomyces lactucae-debilis]